jgi:hypothetical protein
VYIDKDLTKVRIGVRNLNEELLGESGEVEGVLRQLEKSGGMLRKASLGNRELSSAAFLVVGLRKVNRQVGITSCWPTDVKFRSFSFRNDEEGS